MSQGRFASSGGILVADGPNEATHVSGWPRQGAYRTLFPNTQMPIGGSEWKHGFSDGGPWYNFRSLSNKAVGSQINHAPAFSDSLACLNGYWYNDQSVTTTITFANPPTNGTHAQLVPEEVEILLRFSIDQGRAIGYECLWSVVQDATFGRYIQLARWEGGLGQFTKLADGTATLATDGDTFSASIVGTVITVQVNGVTKLTYDTTADNPKYASGAPGIGHYFQNASDLGTYVASDFGLTSFAVTAS